MTNTYGLNFFKLKGYETLPRYKLGGREGFTVGSGEIQEQNDKGTRDSGNHSSSKGHPLPHWLRMSASLHPNPGSLPFQEWLRPQGENQAYGFALLDNSTMLAELLWKIPFYLLQLYDLKLSFPIKYASTDFYEHTPKLLQSFFSPSNLSNQL